MLKTTIIRLIPCEYIIWFLFCVRIVVGRFISYMLIFVLLALFAGSTKDNITEDRLKIRNLIKGKEHQGIALSISRYIDKYGTDGEVKQFQIQWYRQLKKDHFDSSILTTRMVKYKEAPVKGRCSAGELDTMEFYSFKQNLNFVRLIAGLSPVQDIDKESSVNCQKAAWCLTANNRITHNIPKTYKCYTPGAASAASRANLSYGYSAGRALLGLLRDEGSSNISVGHRRWLLNPSLTFPGYGLTDKVMVVQVFGQKSNFRKVYKDLAEYEERGIAWPVAGIHPKFLATKRFSFSLAKASFKNCTITVRKNGKLISIKRYPLKPNFANPTVVFEVNDFPKDGDLYQISIRNVLAKGNVKKNFTYSTTIKDL